MAQNINTPDVVYTITLSKGKTALVSAEDEHFVSQYKWSTVGVKTFQAARSQKGNNRIKYYLGREILARKLKEEEGRELRPGEIVRFKNGDSLDCTRGNLEPRQLTRRK